jgi:branched-chain amino acid transport system ATP-binding protein
MLLEVDGLTVAYGKVTAVSELALNVPEGAIVTVLGANGAGKTSLLEAIMGTVPSKGHCAFGGHTIGRWSTARRVAAGIVLVPEGRKILLSLTVAENLLIGACQRKDDSVEHDLECMFELFPNLARQRKALASVLSGGEQQMLAIGRALMARPKLLLMDEPSLGLSPLLVRDVFNLIRRLNDDGLSILLVEQNTALALETASYGYVLRLGHVVSEADTASLMQTDEIINAYLGGNDSAIPLRNGKDELQ